MSTTDEQLGTLKAERGFMTTKEVAAYMSVSASAIEKMRRAGKLPYVKVGKIVRYERDDVDAYLDSCKVVESTTETQQET